MHSPLVRFWIRYGFAVACAAAAIFSRVSLDSLWGPKYPYLLFHAAVLLAAWVGGLGPGLLATGLCALAAAHVWMPPVESVVIGSAADRLALITFLGIGVAISVLTEVFHRRERAARVVVESIDDGFMVLDRRWRYRYLNERVARLARRRRKDLLRRPIWTIFPELVGTTFETEARRAINEDAPRRFQFFHPALGGWADIHMYASAEGVAVYFRDIAPQKAAEALSSRLAAIVDSSDDAIVSKDLNGQIMTWNPAAERMFGYTAAEAIGQNITLIIPPERRHEEAIVLGRIREGLSVEHFETVRVRKDGQTVDVSLTVSPVRGSDHQVVGASKIARNITARKAIERERTELLARERAARAEAETANRAKDDFLTTLSHELRTPLNAVYGWAAILKSGQVDEATRAKAIDTIMRNSNSQVQLIDDLLDIGRISSGKLRLEVQSVELAPVIEAALEAVRPAALAKSIDLETDLAPSTGPITGDPSRLQQVVWNLLSNAVKFTPAGGRVEVRLARASPHVEIVVRDTGGGITPELLPHVFERFRQGDSSSTRLHAGIGLGLTLVKQLVELHGGTVVAESDGLGQGATFTVRLPMSVALVPAPTVARETAARETAIPATSLARLDGLRVLAVDDDADALNLVATILGRAGATVDSCSSAAQAFEMLVAKPPDVLISDIEMPGEDGYSLIRRVRALGPEEGGRTPAIALTAYGRREDRLNAITAGFSMHVPKPVDPVELTTLVAGLALR
ncbi:MAG TPA: PAS domain S-box protein [Methylomirabilota bacterium]